MPYEDISELPSSIKKVLPTAGQKMFLQAFNKAYGKHDEATAFEIAWGVVKKRFHKNPRGQWVANSTYFTPPQLYRFTLETPEQELIVNAEGDELVIEGILASTTPRKGDGKWFTEEALAAIAEQINNNGSTLPDVEHAVMAALREQLIPADRLPQELSKKKGMFNRIKAAVRDGKLWIKAWLDKQYEKIINLYKFLSIEALAKPQDDGSLVDPEYLGFTFTDTPRVPDAALAGL